jgi:hypothetical protein
MTIVSISADLASRSGINPPCPRSAPLTEKPIVVEIDMGECCLSSSQINMRLFAY